jgi:hypothetical protein
MGAVLKYADDMRTARNTNFGALVGTATDTRPDGRDA